MNHIPSFPPCPVGQSDCRFYSGNMISTCMAWRELYDRSGRRIGEDPNIITQQWACETCGACWNLKSQGGRYLPWEQTAEGKSTPAPDPAP